MKIWQLHEAKSRFSEVVNEAETGEVQVVTRHGREVAVVIDYERWLALSGGTRSALDAFAGAPDLSELDLERDDARVRLAELE